MITNDTFQRFLFDELHIRGEWVRLGDSYQQAVSGVDYPSEIKQLLGQTIAASILLTGTLKFAGRLSIHARSMDSSNAGPISLLMAEATNERTFRGLANWEGNVEKNAPLSELLGNAQLAITIDPDKGARYQGIVPMERDTLSECLAQYFELSEQLDTYLLLGADDDGCFGLMLQKLPDYKNTADQNAWEHVLHLAKTLKKEELLNNDNETLLHRLFHEEKIISYDEETVAFSCSCSRGRTMASVENLGQEEALDILESEAVISVGCQFCGTQYTFDRKDIQELFELGDAH